MKTIYFWLYSKYLNFLLWWDSNVTSKQNRYINPHTQAIVQQAQQMKLAEGVNNIKYNVNKLVKSRTEEEYKRVLDELKDLTELAKDDNIDKEKMFQALRKAYDFSNKDIKSQTDKAKMVKKRVSDYNELKRHKLSRELIRKARAERQKGNFEKAQEIEEEWRKNFQQVKK